MKMICQSRARSIRTPSVETIYGAPLVGEERVQTTNGKPAVKAVVVSNFGIPLTLAELKLCELLGSPIGTSEGDQQPSPYTGKVQRPVERRRGSGLDLRSAKHLQCVA